MIAIKYGLGIFWILSAIALRKKSFAPTYSLRPIP